MPEMFPLIPDTVPRQTGDSIGRVPAFDSTSNRFLLLDGALVERTGREAVQQWFDLMLRQRIDKVPIYRTDGETKLGIDREMLGSRLPSGLITAEIERNVRETASSARRSGRCGTLPSPAGAGPAMWNLRRSCTPMRPWR
ncbi:MAG: DUF2634 domain-containing protein [Dysosmobacter sp.]